MADTVRYLSVCSGIEAATVAWHPLGWTAAAFSEIEAFPRAVLTHHYPDTPLHGDFTTIGADEYGPIDLLVGGTPCQSFSVAGLRKGLADERGNLALEYLRLADRTRARWVVWENVPGVLSSDEGRDFGAFLGGLAELGYGFAYRVLDAQFFGLAQRRKRVFVVGYLGDWRAPAAVLFERHSLSGYHPPRRETGEESAASTGFSVAGAVTHGYGSKLGTDESCQGSVIAVQSVNTPREKKQNGIGVNDSGAMYSLTARDHHAVAYQTSGNCGAWETGVITGALDTNTDPNSHVICFSAKDYGQDALANCAPTLRAGGHSGSHENGGVMPAVAFAQNSRDELREMPYVGALAAEAGMKQTSYIRQSHVVRRLTPLECERLQGFPDYYTLIQRRGKPAADAPRYKALGNSMAVPVMRWLGTRIASVEAMSERLAA